MERLKAALGGDPANGVPPVSIPAYLMACAVAVFVGTLVYLALNLLAPLGTMSLPKGPQLLAQLPRMIGGSLYMAGLFSLLLVVPVAIIAAPLVLPLLVYLQPRGILSRWAAVGLGAVAGIAAIVAPLLIVAAVDTDPMLVRISPVGGLLGAPSGAIAGLTYRALVARHMRVARGI